MADFGWAFVKGGLVSGSAPPSGAVQFNDGSNKFGGSADLVFTSGSTSTLEMTGNILVDGDVSASVYYGDGSNLTGITTSPAGATTQIQYNNAGAFAGSANLTFDGSVLNLTGNLNVSGTLAANELIINVENRTVVNISATGSTQFGDSTDDTHIFTGSMEISAASNPLKLFGVQAGTPPNQSRYLALDANYNLVITSAAGLSQEGGTIGEAEDGSYEDGLFTDFVSSTAIGTAIDRFNEILKIIVPGPAPSVDRINYTNDDGIETNLSFEEFGEPSDYIAVSSIGSFTTFPTINQQYTVATSGEDYRLGVYDGSQEITGAINFNVLEQLKTTEINYSNNAFGNAESGSLKLYLNGVLLHSLDLNGFTGIGNPNSGSASDLNANGSGFFDISIAKSARDQNGSEYSIFQHRTAKFIVDPQDHNKGWNYVKIDHVYGSVTYTTNFVQWFNDTDAYSESMETQNQTATFTGLGSKFLSGVEYFRSGSIEYNADVSNFYKYTYPTGNVVTFNTDSVVDSISAISASQIGPGEDYNKLIQVTGNTSTNDDVILGGSTTISINVSHPLKPNIISTGSVLVDEILVYNKDTSNSNLLENFELENYRLISNSYNNQTLAKNSSQLWDSTIDISSLTSGYSDGLLFYNSRLYSPRASEVVNSGDFSSLSNGPVGNKDYSSVSGTKTFYRKLENTTLNPVYDLKIISTKNTKINNTTLTTDNVKFSIKIPGTTGWMDISQNFSYGNISDDDGALINGASSNSNTSVTSTSDSTHCVTFGTASVAPGDYVIIRIQSSSELWAKYFETLQFQLGASTLSATQAPVLDDIQADATGIGAILSFGVSNTIPDYSNVLGSGTGSMGNTNFNFLYTFSGDKKGIFNSFSNKTGILNRDVVASGQNYPQWSFFNGYSGSIALIVNGLTASTLDLESTQNLISNISSGTGFSVSAVSFSKTSDLIPDYNKPYRTGTYSIGAGIQRAGWNYARVVHITDSEQETNYVEWIVDPSGSINDTSISSPVLTDFDHTDVYYQSGIGYFASNPTASFSFNGSNFYRNVYQAGNGITFGVTQSVSIYEITGSGTGLTTRTISSNVMGMPLLNGNPQCEETDISVEAKVRYNGPSTSISGGLGIFTAQGVGIAGNLWHPFKTDRQTTTATKSSFMRYSGSIGLTTEATKETFGLETFRIVSGNYANQASVTSSSNTWDSTISINDTASYAEYADGMVTANGYAISPLQIGVAGNTGHSNLQAPSGNPDYSTLDLSERTYYRYFKNNSGILQASGLTITLKGDATLVAADATLGANKNVKVEIKVPYDPSYTGGNDRSTGWCDVGSPMDDQLDPKVDGFGIYAGTLDSTIDSAGATNTLNFYSSGIYANQYFVVKITAHKDWTGYISEIGMVYA